MAEKNVQKKIPTKVLKSIKSYTDAIIRAWISQNEAAIDKKLTSIELFKLLPSKSLLHTLISLHLSFALNVNEVKRMQCIAPVWEENQKEIFALCEKNFTLFIAKFQEILSQAVVICKEIVKNEAFSDAEKNRMYLFSEQIILSELIILLRHGTPQFERYTIDKDRFELQLKSVLGKNQ